MLVEIETIDKGHPTTMVKVEEDSGIVEELVGVDTTLVDSIIPVRIEEDNY
jgi:hypothetical protein